MNVQQRQFKTADFEGPLDLLLYIISKNRMKLYEIRILDLIDQYLEAVGGIGPQELDDASEFLDMAARLVYLKSSLLLPKSDEAQQLERELTGQLIEYSLCKQAARKLASMAQGLELFVREQAPLSADDLPPYSHKHDPVELSEAFFAMSLKGARRRSPDPNEVAARVARPAVPVAVGIFRVLRGLRSGTSVTLRSMFMASHSVSEAVATFLGLLELIRSGRVAVDREGNARLIEKEKTPDGQELL